MQYKELKFTEVLSGYFESDFIQPIFCNGNITAEKYRKKKSRFRQWNIFFPVSWSKNKFRESNLFANTFELSDNLSFFFFF